MTKRIVLLQALASTLKDLGYILTDLDGVEDVVEAPRVSSRVSSGVSNAEQWSIGEVLGHLVYVERGFQERFRRILEEDNPTVPEILPEDTPFDVNGRTAEQLTLFKVARVQTVTMLKALSMGQWQRPAVHETMGKTTLRFMVQLLMEHDIEHLNQIVEIQQAARKVPVRDAQPAVRKEEK